MPLGGIEILDVSGNTGHLGPFQAAQLEFVAPGEVRAPKVVMRSYARGPAEHEEACESLRMHLVHSVI